MDSRPATRPRLHPAERARLAVMAAVIFLLNAFGWAIFVFTNTSSVPCTLYGYPGVSMTTGQPGSQIGKPAKENPATPRQLVTLQPQASASALLRIVFAQNYPAAQCHPVTAHYLQVYPPNQTMQTYVSYHTTGCAKPIRLMTVDVVKPGSGSSS